MIECCLLAGFATAAAASRRSAPTLLPARLVP
jgi:hypothetical protein